MSTTSNSTIIYTPYYTTTGTGFNSYYVNSYNYTFNYVNNVYNDYSITFTEPKEILTPENVTDTSLVLDTEEKIEEYIYDHYDKYDILEMKEYVYSIIQDKAYDIIEQILEDAKDDYDIINKDKVAEVIFNNIDFSSLCEIIDNIADAPVTIEEKLADVGMSERDFF